MFSRFVCGASRPLSKAALALVFTFPLCPFAFCSVRCCLFVCPFLCFCLLHNGILLRLTAGVRLRHNHLQNASQLRFCSLKKNREERFPNRRRPTDDDRRRRPNDRPTTDRPTTTDDDDRTTDDRPTTTDDNDDDDRTTDGRTTNGRTGRPNDRPTTEGSKKGLPLRGLAETKAAAGHFAKPQI